MQTPRQPQIIAGRVNTDGTVAVGDNFTSRRTATGIYILSFPSNFRLVAVTVSVITNYVLIDAGPYQGDGTSVQISISTTIGSFTANDQAFAFIAAGVQQ